MGPTHSFNPVTPMKTYYDCIPCFIRQAIEAARIASAEEDVHERILRAVLESASRLDLRRPPPLMGRDIHRLVREIAQHQDPYASIKTHYNQFALELYFELKQKVAASESPLESAIRLAMAGNIIDFGVDSQLDQKTVIKAIDQALDEEVYGNIDHLIHEIENARQILYLGDNAGEIVLDRVLIEQLPTEKIIFAVRGSPIINDATLADAKAVGLTNIVKVIDNGSDVPGTALSECSPEFVAYFQSADLIVSKGQGNFETLSEVSRNIYFLLKAKCPVVARHLGCEMGRLVVKKSEAQ